MGLAAKLDGVDPLRATVWPEGLEPYAVVRSEFSERGNQRVVRLDPTRTSSAPFLRSLERLDRLVYGPSGMATPRWAFYDCAELPGAVYGLCVSANQLPEEVREALAACEREGAVPLSAVVAIPTVVDDHWLVYAICELGEAVDTGFPDLRSEMLRAALSWLGAREVSAVCGWADDRISLHLHCAPLELRAAWMPSHDRPATCCIRYVTHRPESPPSGRHTWISGTDGEALQDLQAKIERGHRFLIVEARSGASGPEFALCEDLTS